MLIGGVLIYIERGFMIRRILMLAFVLLVLPCLQRQLHYKELQTSPQFKLVHHHEFSNPVKRGASTFT